MRIKLQRLAITISWLILSAFHLAAQGAAEMPPQLKLYVETGHTSFIHSVAFSPDGKILASASEDNTVKLWYAGKEISTLTGHSSIVSSVVFSPDGKILATADYDGVIKLWNVADSMRELKKLTEHVNAVSSIAFSPNGKTLVSGSWDNSIKLWDVATGNELKTFAGTSEIESVAFSPDGKMIASGSRDKLVHLWDVDKSRQVTTFLGHSNQITSVAFSPNGKLIASAGLDRTIKLWNIRTRHLLKTFKGHKNSVETIAFSRNGDKLVSGSWDETVKLWDINSAAALKTLARHSSVVSSVVFSPDGKVIASGSYDKTIKLWDATSGRELSTIKGHTNFVLSSAFSPNSKTVAIANTDKSVRLWDIASRQEFKVFPVDNFIRALTFSPDSKILAFGGDENTIKLWNITSDESPKTLSGGHNSIILSLAFSPDGKMLASGSDDKIIKLWDVIKGTELKTLLGNTSYVNLLAFSIDKKILASRSADDKIRLWNTDSKEELISFEFSSPDAASKISALVPDFYRIISNITPNGNFQIKESENGKLNIHEARTGKLLVTLIALDEKDWVAVTPEGRFDTNKSLESIKGLHWLAPDTKLDALSVEIFMRDYFEPRLLPRLLKCSEDGSCDREFKEIRDLSSLNRTQPKVEITRITPSISPKTVEITVKVDNVISQYQRDRQGRRLSSGVYDLRLFRDGQMVGYSTKEENLQNTFRIYKDFEEELTVWRQANKIDLVNDKKTFTFKVRLPDNSVNKEIEFSAYAFNEDRVKSETSRRTFPILDNSYPKKELRRRAYVITFGVNKYDNPEWDLQFAGNDARAMNKIFSAKLLEQKEFAEVIRIPLISDDEIINGKTIEKRDAVKGNIQAVLQLLAGKTPDEEGLKKLERAVRAETLIKLQAAKPGDLVLIFFSSHGYADRNGIFYILPTDIGKDSGRKVTNDLLQRSISSDELSMWLRDVDAGEMVMIVDACHAASAVEGMDFKPAPMGSRGLGQLAFDKAMKILTATQAANVAIESGGSIRHGLLTYALLREGIEKGEADFRTKDKTINLREWLEFGEFSVPSLYEKLAKGELKGIGKDVEIVNLGDEGKSGKALQTPSLFDFTKKKQEMILLQIP